MKLPTLGGQGVVRMGEWGKETVVLEVESPFEFVVLYLGFYLV